MSVKNSKLSNKTVNSVALFCQCTRSGPLAEPIDTASPGPPFRPDLELIDGDSRTVSAPNDSPLAARHTAPLTKLAQSLKQVC
jgi:hypothetical protein